jgi:hypothetical protein
MTGMVWCDGRGAAALSIGGYRRCPMLGLWGVPGRGAASIGHRGGQRGGKRGPTVGGGMMVEPEGVGLRRTCVVEVERWWGNYCSGTQSFEPPCHATHSTNLSISPWSRLTGMGETLVCVLYCCMQTTSIVRAVEACLLMSCCTHTNRSVHGGQWPGYH